MCLDLLFLMSMLWARCCTENDWWVSPILVIIGFLQERTVGIKQQFVDWQVYGFSEEANRASRYHKQIQGQFCLFWMVLLRNEANKQLTEISGTKQQWCLECQNKQTTQKEQSNKQLIEVCRIITWSASSIPHQNWNLPKSNLTEMFAVECCIIHILKVCKKLGPTYLPLSICCWLYLSG
jgi:hypothetical protein